MNLVLTLLLAVQILSALGMVGLILMQHGKGADAGAAFGGGGGGSASLFGASGSANFLSRSTAVLATLFLACTLGLAYFGNPGGSATNAGGSVLQSTPVPVEAPAAAASSAAPAATPADAAPATAAPEAAQIPAQ